MGDTEMGCKIIEKINGLLKAMEVMTGEMSASNFINSKIANQLERQNDLAEERLRKELGL